MGTEDETMLQRLVAQLEGLEEVGEGLVGHETEVSLVLRFNRATTLSGGHEVRRRGGLWASAALSRPTASASANRSSVRRASAPRPEDVQPHPKWLGHEPFHRHARIDNAAGHPAVSRSRSVRMTSLLSTG